MDHQHPHQHPHEHTHDEHGEGVGFEDDGTELGGRLTHDHVAHSTGSSTPPDAADTAAAQTLLPVVRQPGGYPKGLLLLDDADQLIDHGGKAVSPVTDAGMPYRYKVRLPGRSAYATTADEVLALFVPDYPLPTPGDTRTKQEVALDLVRSRGQHCLGVMVNHVALAILGGGLTSEEEQVLQRSAELDETGPIATKHCERWAHQDVAMVLMGDLYAPQYGRYEPPTGNVMFLFPGNAERYLTDLAALGLLALSQNPAWTSAPLVEVAGTWSDGPVHPGSSGFSNDQIVLVLLGVGAVVVLAAKRHVLMAQLRAWLEAKKITLAGQEGLLSTPLGGFDVPRLLVAGGLVVLVAVVARFVLRRQRAAAEPR